MPARISQKGRPDLVAPRFLLLHNGWEITNPAISMAVTVGCQLAPRTVSLCLARGSVSSEQGIMDRTSYCSFSSRR